MIAAVATAISKSFQPNPVMTLRELYAALDGFHIYLVRSNRKWIARGWIAGEWVGATGATPIDAVAGLLRKRGGQNGS